MARPVRAGCPATPTASGLEVATIVRAHGAAVRRQQALSREQRQALRAIAVCRTPALGGHVDVCTTCGLERPAYHSCRNRHCPKCQSLAQARWIAQRMTRFLDTDYFHVVFTLPAALRPLALAHRRLHPAATGSGADAPRARPRPQAARRPAGPDDRVTYVDP
jgi:hypothetical protein